MMLPVVGVGVGLLLPGEGVVPGRGVGEGVGDGVGFGFGVGEGDGEGVGFGVFDGDGFGGGHIFIRQGVGFANDSAIACST